MAGDPGLLEIQRGRTGYGAYGVVCRASAADRWVFAVKVLYRSGQFRSEIENQISIMKVLDHVSSQTTLKGYDGLPMT